MALCSSPHYGLKCLSHARLCLSGKIESKRKPPMPYLTSCHCGAVSIEMHRPIRKLTQCNCSICRRYGALWAYQQRKAIRVSDEKNALKSYRWGDEALEFFHCSICGCITHYDHTNRRDDGSDMSAINMRNINDPSRIAHLPVRLLDGAGTWKVLAEKAQPNLLMSP